MANKKRRREDESGEAQYSAMNIAKWIVELANNTFLMNRKIHKNVFSKMAYAIQQWDKRQLLDIEQQARKTICLLAKIVSESKIGEINLAVEAYGRPDEALGAMIDIMQHCCHHELLSIEQNAPGTIKAIAMATSKECNTLTPISKQLKNIANQDLYEIEQQSKGTIKALAASVGSGSSDGLDAICTQLKSFTKAQLLEINRGSDETISQIAQAASHSHYPKALQAIAIQFGKLTGEESVELARNYTMLSLTKAACSGYPEALNAISAPLGRLMLDQIKAINDSTPNSYEGSNNTIMGIVKACAHGHESAMLSIMAKFAGNNNNGMLKKSLQFIVARVIRKSCCGKNLALLRTLSDLGWQHFIRPAYLITWCDYIVNCLKSKTVKGYRDALYFIKSEILVACSQHKRKNRLFFLRQIIDYCESLLERDDNDVIEMKRLIDKLKKCMIYYSQCLPDCLPATALDIEMQALVMPLEPTHGLFNTVRQQLAMRYRSLKLLNAGLGTYIHAGPERSLATALETMKQQFYHWVHTVVHQYDRALFSNSEMWRLQLEDMDYDDIHILLKNCDFDGAIQYIKNQRNSQSGLAIITDERDTTHQQPR